MTTPEIEKAANKLQSSTLKNSLKVFDVNTNGDKEELVKKYNNTVLEVGLKNFVSKLKDKDVKASCKAINLEPSSSDAKGLRKALEEAVLKNGIKYLLNKADEGLLTNFCVTLALESPDQDSKVKEIEDECTNFIQTCDNSDGDTNSYAHWHGEFLKPTYSASLEIALL